MRPPSINKLQIALFFLILAGGVFLFASYTAQEEYEASTPLLERVFPGLSASLPAKGVEVYDTITKKTLLSAHADDQLPLASLTKIMTALVAYESLPASTPVTITKRDLEPEGDSGLIVGETWNLKDLIDFTLIVSSNDGARAVALADIPIDPPLSESDMQIDLSHFYARMNAKAQEIGLKQAFYQSENGLDMSTTTPGAVDSAKDMALLIAYCIKAHPDLLSATRFAALSFASQQGFIHNAKNTDSDIGSIPHLIASKTGTTDLAGGNLIIAFDADDTGVSPHPIVIVILGDTPDGRFVDMRSLIDDTLIALKQQKGQ
jgi:serine-type D-Ala-D-Ala carboxypeptidase (penicillin-binding protein 5/6)